MGKMYEDARGWRYRVMQGLGASYWKARYHKPGSAPECGWKGVRTIPWRRSRKEAQDDLDELATRKGWREVCGVG